MAALELEKTTEKSSAKPLKKGREATEKTTEKTTEKILSVLQKNPSISVNEIAEKLGISHHTIDWNFRKLRKDKLIRRIGPDKGGQWEVLRSID